MSRFIWRKRAKEHFVKTYFVLRDSDSLLGQQPAKSSILPKNAAYSIATRHKSCERGKLHSNAAYCLGTPHKSGKRCISQETHLAEKKKAELVKTHLARLCFVVYIGHPRLLMLHNNK